MTGVNKMTSESAVMGMKDSNAKNSKTDVFQSVMNIAQQVSTKVETTSSENQLEKITTKENVKDIIIEKINSAKHAIRTKSNLDDMESRVEELMGQLIVSIKQEVMNTLGVTEEELAAAMKSLGLNDVDLLSSANIMDLTVHMLTGERTSLELLFNPDFAETLKELQSNIKDLQTDVLKELNITEKEFFNLVKQTISDVQKTDNIILTEDHVDNNLANTTTNNKTTEQTVESKVSEDVSKPLETIVISETEDSNSGNSANGNQNYATNAAITTATNSVSNLEAVLETITDELDASSIVKQISDEFQVNVKQGVSSMELQLNPEHLGKIHLEVVAKNGVITASIAAETQMAKEAIESQMLVLRENLINQGIKVEEVEVTIATHQFEQNLDGHKEKEEENRSGKRKLDLNDLDLELENLDPQEILEQSIMLSNGNSVNLTV